jgi:hypothetical protein
MRDSKYEREQDSVEFRDFSRLNIEPYAAEPAISRNSAICLRNDRIWFQLGMLGDAIAEWSIPDTWGTDYSGHIGNTFAPNGFSTGSSRHVSSSK